MKSPITLAILSLLALGSAHPGKKGKAGFPLEGFGKTNPLGETTGGKGGATTTVTSPEALKTAVAGNKPLNIVLKGDFKLPSRLSIGSNKSLLGAGKGAKISQSGIDIKSQTNVIVQNLLVSNITGNDGITINNSTRLWIDHNEFRSQFSTELGPDEFDGQLDIIHAADWITVSWNYFHDHWKSSLIGNSDTNRAEDEGTLHVTYHHNYWQNEGTRGPAGRFGHQHIYNNLYRDFLYQAIHSRSDNQVLVEANVFRGNTRTALTTYGLVIPEDSPNTSPDGDFEIDGFANLGAKNDFGSSIVNITQKGDFTKVDYKYTLTALKDVEKVVQAGVGLGKL